MRYLIARKVDAGISRVSYPATMRIKMESNRILEIVALSLSND